jgi:hypothetical protein
LCELEAACDIGQLDDTPLGGLQTPNVPAVTPDTTDGGPALAIGEQDDLSRAQAAVSGGDLLGAVDQLLAFVDNYPGSPLTADAHFLRGQALEGLGLSRGVFRQPNRPQGARIFVQTWCFTWHDWPDPRRVFDVGRG